MKCSTPGSKAGAVTYGPVLGSSFAGSTPRDHRFEVRKGRVKSKDPPIMFFFLF
jgi:hypothetical protein